MTESDRARWDERHGARAPVELHEVALPAVFRPYDDLFPTAGHALELACGRGAVATWLATRGLDVLAVDVSPAAVDAARDLARRAGVGDRCRVEVHDLDSGLPLGPPADLVVCNRIWDPRLPDAITDRIRPGGLLAIDVLSEVDAAPGPYRVRAGALLAAFAALEVLAADEEAGEAWLVARRRLTS